MHSKAHKAYLHITALVIWSFGPVFALGSMLETSELARLSLDVLAWPIDGQQDYQAPTTRFLSALTGGFLFGWGICIACLRAWVYDLAPEAVRKTVCTSLLAWCCLDSLGSYCSGNTSNVFFNILVLALAIGPLWKTPNNQV